MRHVFSHKTLDFLGVIAAAAVLVAAEALLVSSHSGTFHHLLLNRLGVDDNLLADIALVVMLGLLITAGALISLTSDDQPPLSGITLGLILIFLLFLLFELVWDIFIAQVYAPRRLYEVQAYCLIGLVLFFLLQAASWQFLWRRYVPNRVTFWIIQLYLERFPDGALYTRLRQLRYRIFRWDPPAERYEQALLALINQEQSRIEVDLDDLKIKALNGKPLYLEPTTQENISQYLSHAWALAAYRYPPNRVEPTDDLFSSLLLHEEALFLETELQRLGLLDEEFTQRLKDHHSRQQKLLDLYGGRTDSYRRLFVELRQAALNGNREALVTKASNLLFAPRSDSQYELASDDWQAVMWLGLNLWLDRLADDRDYQAEIQTINHLLTESSIKKYALPADMVCKLHKLLGYAWWQYGYEIGEPYAPVAWQQVLEHFVQANFQRGIDQLTIPEGLPYANA